MFTRHLFFKFFLFVLMTLIASIITFSKKKKIRKKMLPSTLDMAPSPSTWNSRPSALDPRQKDRLFLIYFNWSLSVKAVNDDSYRNESERKLFTMTLHDYDMKRPNFTFYGVPERKTTIFICFSKLWDLCNLTPKKELRRHLANWTRWNKGDLGIKFETHRECNF